MFLATVVFGYIINLHLNIFKFSVFFKINDLLFLLKSFLSDV